MKKILILGIICLFIGVGIQPAFAHENISINRPSSGNIEDCNCQVADNYNLVVLERLFNRIESVLNRVETCNKLIPFLFKDNPEVIKDCEELSEKINTFREMNNEFKSDSALLDNNRICDFLLTLIVIIMFIWEEITFDIQNEILAALLILLYLPAFTLMFISGYLYMVVFDCHFPVP